MEMRTAAKIEQYLPYAIGVGAALVAGFVPPLHPFFVDGVAIDRSSLYVAAFDFLAVTTPFLFAFYAFAVAPIDGFLAKLLNTQTHRTYVKFIFFAILWGTIAVVSTVPFLIAHKDGVLDDFLSGVWWIWVGITVAALMLFFRVVRITFLSVRLYYNGKANADLRLQREVSEVRSKVS